MIEADPAIGTGTSWQRLTGDQGATVSCYTLRTYVFRRRTGRQAPPTGR